MKKFSKILAVLLTTCVLLGLVAVFASADTADYREHEYDFTTLSGANVPAAVLNAWTTNKDGTKLSSTAELTSMAQVTAGDNTYTRFYAVAGNAAASADYNTQAKDDIYKIKDYKYAVVQFLFGAEGGNYVDGSYIKPMVSVSNSNFGAIKIVLHSDGKYYAEGGYDSTTAVNSAPLKEVDGDWNIVTMVIKPRHNNSNAVGTNANYAVYYYVNGVYTAHRTAGSAVDLGHVYALRVGRLASTNVSAGDNIMLDGYNARYYLNGLDIANNAYTTPDFQGIDDFIPKYTTDDITQCKDIKYNAYSTTKDFPSTLDQNGNLHEQSGAKVYIGDVGYMDAAGAFMNLKENETARIYGDVTVTGVAAKNYTIEVYNNAKASFGGDVVASSNILPGKHSDGIVRYVVSPRVEVECVELSNNFDTLPNMDWANNVYRTWTCYDTHVQYPTNSASSATGLLASAGGNKYWKMYPVTTRKAGDTGTMNGSVTYHITTDKAASNTTTDFDLFNYRYAVSEFLFMAENLNYVDGMFIGFRSDNSQSSTTRNPYGVIYIVLDENGKAYAANAGTYASATVKTPLSTTEGAWNMVAQVSAITKTNTAENTATVVTHTYINGQYFMTTTATDVKLGAMTTFLAQGPKNSTAKVGSNFCVDGISARYFGSISEDYTSANYYGIDDFFTDYNDGVAGASPVNCDDIVYNYATTVLPETNGKQEFKASINGDYSFLYADSAFLYVEDGDVVTLFVDHKVESLPADIETINFDGSGAVSFSDAILEKYTFLDGALVKNINYTVNWIFAKGAEPFRTDKVTYTIAAKTLPSADWLTDVETDILGDYTKASAWKYSVNNGVYKALDEIEICADGDVITIEAVIAEVKWYHANGSTMKNEKWFAGSEIAPKAPDAYEGGVLNNGWYEVKYDWSSDDLIAKEGEMKYYQVKNPISALDIRFNFTLDGGLTPTFYIDTPLNNVKIKSVLASSDFESGLIYNYANGYNITRIGGKDYYAYNLGNVSLADYNDIYSFQVTYEIELDGIVYELTSKTAKASILYENEAEGVVSYAKAILSSASNASCSKETAFIASLIELVRDVYAFENDGEINDIIDEYVKAHKAANADCTCFGNAIENLPHTTDGRVSYKEITDKNIELSYVINGGVPTLTVKIPKLLGTKTQLSVVATLSGIDYNGAKNRNEAGRSITVKFKYASEDEDFYVYSANTASLKAYNAANVQKIAVSCSGNVIATGTFSLAEYVYKMNEALDFYKWLNVDSDNNGNIDGFVPNPEPFGTEAEAKEFNALLAYLHFAKASQDYMTVE